MATLREQLAESSIRPTDIRWLPSGHHPNARRCRILF